MTAILQLGKRSALHLMIPPFKRVTRFLNTFFKRQPFMKEFNGSVALVRKGLRCKVSKSRHCLSSTWKELTQLYKCFGTS